jgi:hypothetical protein
MSRYNRTTLLAGLGIALAIGGVVSYFASPDPDGLEKTQERLGAAEPTHAEVPAPPSAFHEYTLKGIANGFAANAAAGVAGTFLVLAILLGVGYALRRRRAAAHPPAQP